MTISRLTSVPLRDLWPHEAYDFTTWRAGNLDLVGEALGMDLSLLEREASAGTFSADILAEADVIFVCEKEPQDRGTLVLAPGPRCGKETGGTKTSVAIGGESL